MIKEPFFEITVAERETIPRMDAIPCRSLGDTLIDTVTLLARIISRGQFSFALDIHAGFPVFGADLVAFVIITLALTERCRPLFRTALSLSAQPL